MLFSLLYKAMRLLSSVRAFSAYLRYLSFSLL